MPRTAPARSAAQAVDLALHLLRDAQAIADRAVLADIESECHQVRDEAGARWYDTRPMTDPREHSDDVIEMAQQALRYAIGRGLVKVHPGLDYWVRVAPR